MAQPIDPNDPKYQGAIEYFEREAAKSKDAKRMALGRFLEPSEVKQRMYHGTGQDIRQFRPKQAGASFVTPDPKFAHDFADLSESWMKRNVGAILTGEQIERAKDLTAKELTERMKQRKIQSYEREIALIGSPQAHPYTQTLYANKLAEQLPSAQNIMPVHVQAKKPFDYENPKHIHAVRTMLHKLGHTQHIDDFDTAMRGGKGDDANWHTIESKPVQQAIRALGHDSFWVKEGGVKNLGVYNPGAIKSAIGNRGTYDTEDYDVNKAQGGAVKPVKLKEGQQPPYQDPKTSKIDDWKWHPMERIRQELSARRELPEHVGPYADYMREMNAKAQSGELTPRDFVKAYTITQSSIGRGGLSHSTATKRGMKLPNTGGEVRPEGAFAEWLGSPMGQKYLEASMRGEDHPEALADLREKFAPFGKQNAQVEAMQYATQNAPSLGERLNKAITGSKADYRKYAGGIRGIASAKSGFIGSLLGRGDLPTLDARQLNLHSLSHPTKTPEGMMSRGKGLGGQEAVDRLIARQEALGYNIPNELKPYEQHLIHHDVWDQRGGTQTTHKDLTKAMLGYADGGDVEKMRQALMVKHLAGGTKQPKAVLLPQSDPEYQRIMDKWRSGKKLSAAENVNLGISHPVSAVKLRAPIGTLGYKERADPNQPVSPEKFITPENLQGGAGIPLIGDMARLGELTHVGDEELPTPVRMQAGAHHMRKIKPPGESSIWASAPSIITRQSKLVKTAIGMPGVDKVYGLHASMLPTGVDFGKPLSKTLVGQLQNNPPHPEIGNAFNEGMRKRYPEFAGVENPAELHEQLMADTRRAPGMRKAFVKLMDSAPYQNAGMPSVGHARVAISDPEQLNLPVHSIGMGIGEYEPTGRIIRKATMPHEDYSAESAGKHTGRFEVPMSRGEMFPEWEAKRRELNMSTSADPRSFSMSMPIQKYDQEWVDKVMPLYLAKRKAILGRAKGGSVSMDEMLAHTTLGKKAPNVRNIGADEAPDMKVKQYIPPGPSNGLGLPAGGVDFQPEMPGQQLTQAAPAGPGGLAMPGMPGMPSGGPGMPPGGPGPGMPGMPPPLPRNQPGMPTGKPAGLEPPNIPPPKQKPTGSNILSMTPQGQALAALGPMRKMADGGSVPKKRAPTPQRNVYNLLRKFGRMATSTEDAERALSNGDRVFFGHDMEEEKPTEVRNTGDMSNYTSDQIIILPARHMADGGGVKSKVEVRPTVKGETLQRKIPEMETAVKALHAGIIDHAEYDRIVAKHKPVKPYDFVPQPASNEDAARALKDTQKPHWRGAEQWPAGRKVGLRLDIPAYEKHGVWVNSIHDEEGTEDNKFNTSYGPVSSVKNAAFDPKPSKAERVATGEQYKSPFARIKGELHPISENDAVKLMQEHLHHPDWAQVGMDPRRHGFFYDRKTLQPVTHSEHVVQIGPLVLAKKPKYGKRETYSHGGGVTLPPSTEQMRQALSARRSNSKA